MLLNLSHELPKKNKIITEQVGKPFPLEERKKLEGISISNLPVSAASIDIYNLLVLNESQSSCSIEMRPKGILIGFRVQADTYSLVIPFYKLKIYKGRAEEYSFYKDHYFIKIWAGKTDTDTHSFIRKVKNYQADTGFTRVEDML
ncbi:hypothetical protein [Salinimicrobium flavum]|uniref:KTSC domain-containing protein n=1 Tax=Salinimicrobium flavum TaxID=1737065 RepID=A0ABW5J0W7_9FLAO